jgi:hypothetical protein
VNDFSAYHVILKNLATDKVLWRSDKLSASRKSNVIQVAIPASKLTSQNYVLELFGISATGDAEIVSAYPFRVAKE